MYVEKFAVHGSIKHKVVFTCGAITVSDIVNQVERYLLSFNSSTISGEILLEYLVENMTISVGRGNGDYGQTVTLIFGNKKEKDDSGRFKNKLKFLS